MKKTILRSFVLFFIAFLFLFFMDRAGLLQWEAILAALQTNPLKVMGVALLQIATAGVMMLRYRRLLNLFGIQASFRQVSAATFVIQALGQWFPGSLAVIELMRVALMSGPTTDVTQLSAGVVTGVRSRLALVSLVDRLVGFLGILLTGFASSLLVFSTLQSPSPSVVSGVVILSLTSGFGVLCLVALPFAVRSPALKNFLDSFPHSQTYPAARSQVLLQRVLVHAKGLRHDIEAGTRHPGRLRLPVVLSVTSMLLTSASLYFAAGALSFELDFLQIVSVFPMVSLASLLPLGFAGMGGYQLVMAAIFGLFAVSPANVASAGVLQSAVLLVVNTGLGLLFAREGWSRFRSLTGGRPLTEGS